MSFQDKQLKSDSAKRTEAEILAAHKKKEREAAKQGKQPFFIKKCIVPLYLSIYLSQCSSIFFPIIIYFWSILDWCKKSKMFQSSQF